VIHVAVTNSMNRPMKLRYSFAALALTLLLAACATQSPARANATDIVCDQEAPIASPTSPCNQREE
jgi:hypothetical protein